MRLFQLIRPVTATVFAGALGVCLMGASQDPITGADMNFAPTAMNALTQSIANAEAVQTGSASPAVNKLAAQIQTDELGLGTQLASLADYYGVNVKTDLPKANDDASTFVHDQVTALTNLIAIMEAERNGGNASQLRTFADGAVTVLQKDLQAAQAAEK
ncbi:MAG TPA: DUF4142 domain-containing protein [Candidatus Aquilonibacter sp.]|nr:DUF4142 domain-containing protein [Candidatus Aquilonibacter sp.]